MSEQNRAPPMNRDEWCGWFQTFAEARMRDAPDETCKAIAEQVFDLLAEMEDDDNA